MKQEILSKRDVVMLSRCLSIAENSNCKQKHGALIYKGGRVLSTGFNTTRNQHPTMLINTSDYTVHAEIAAMRQLDASDLRGATIYIGRIGRSRPALNSMPCPDCASYIEAAGIKRVVVTL